MTDTISDPTTLAPTSRSLPIALIRAREAMLRELRPMLAEAGVSEPQWRILRVLSERGPCSVQGLAQAACLQPASVSRILQSMVERALVERVQDRENRRRQVVSVTEKGRALLACFAPASRKITATFVERFGPERYEHLIALLDDFISEFDEPFSSSPADGAFGC
ncbi:MarR family transcriptional regulator (plasmid) [Ponticoccus alexandrii]|uniref:MarR family transcriptional regulator n=2 Tax=Ponticoccus alexandrii TaxID=1943633 RepID=A0ABX7FFM5_9RHOB|nr:MarR family transcriptional regulator [Ponticoccus alexandrii]